MAIDAIQLARDDFRDLARDDFAAPLALPLVGDLRVEDADGIADRCEWIAQLVRERREEFILAPVRREQRAFACS